jgi:mRNA-degrading endonuclease toxin of MazEF toxin-antitoxin module
VITVVPVTSNTDRVYPFQVLLPADATGMPPVPTATLRRGLRSAVGGV